MTQIYPHSSHQRVIVTSAADFCRSPLLCPSGYLPVQECLVTGNSESPASTAEKCKHAHVQPRKPLGEKWCQQKPGKGPSPSSQAACLLVNARGIGSPLKWLRACVHVFKRQCYVSARHLGASALKFSPILTPSFSSHSQWYKSTIKGLTGQGLTLLCRHGSLVSLWKKKSLVNY